jgi:hypothetical protein
MQMARLLLWLARWDGAPVWLAMDRTNWEFGETNHNLLVLSVQIGDSAIPLVWMALDKAGNSNARERITLMQRVLLVLPAEKIAGVLADREFIGEAWLSWLIAHDIPFVTRVKENMIARLPDGRVLPLKQLFRSIGVCPSLRYRVTLNNNLHVTVQAKRTEKGLVIVACHGISEDAAEPVNLYRKRWKIECAFACLKRKGFELEDTHLIHADRLEKLMSIAAIAYAWAFIVGKKHPTPATKNHGYKANCTFTLGKKTLIHALQHTEKIATLVAYAFNIMGVKHAVV